MCFFGPLPNKSSKKKDRSQLTHARGIKASTKHCKSVKSSFNVSRGGGGDGGLRRSIMSTRDFWPTIINKSPLKKNAHLTTSPRRQTGNTWLLDLLCHPHRRRLVALYHIINNNQSPINDAVIVLL